MVIASHEEAMARFADRRIVLGQSSFRDEGHPESAAAAPTVEQNRAREGGSALPELLAFLTPTAGRLALASLLGTAATLFAITLLAISGWLIVRASEEHALMYLSVAIVGVRFFGLGRAVLRYAERLLTHDAALGSVTELRLRLWRGLAALGPASRGLATGGAAIDYLVASADRVRDLVPRVVLPVITALASVAAVCVAVALVHPAALPALGVLPIAVVVAPVVAVLADRRAASGQAELRSTVLRRFSALVSAAPDLAANGVGDSVLDDITALDRRASAHASTSARALGLGGAIAIAASAVTAALMLSTSNGASPAIVAVLVLLPLGLIDPLLALVEAAQQWPALASALRKVAAITTADPPARVQPRARVEQLALRELAATWPGASAPAFSRVNATARHGDWIVADGPSGSGKSTLLATVLGFVPPSTGHVLFDGAEARARVAWCPQEGHLFDSTIRSNLLIARDRDDQPNDEELHAALTRVGLGPLLDRLPEGLATRVGSHGDELSGGERQRLAVARALLTRADVVLLDEPTAHLDAEGAEALMRDLRLALADRIVLLVTHHPDEALASDIRIHLGQVPSLV
jgi:ATP-binding cassette subfamily C protein CydCD